MTPSVTEWITSQRKPEDTNSEQANQNEAADDVTYYATNGSAVRQNYTAKKDEMGSGEQRKPESETETKILDQKTDSNQAIKHVNGFHKNGEVSKSYKNGTANGFKSVPYMETPPEGKKCLGIDGYWYDIGSFINKHPGGPVIEEFVGYDATDAYRSFHKSNVLKERHFRPIGYYNKDWFEFNKAMSKLHDDLLEEGFYKVNYYWYAMKFGLTFLYISLVFALVGFYGDSWLALSLAAPVLAFFWQQNGFLMHDLMHTQVTHNRNVDEMLGVWSGTVCIGISASWWKDEHMYHHALTCIVDFANNFFDPQMKEEVWAQSPKLFPFFRATRPKLNYILIKIQHITFIPVCMLLGRTSIIIDSFHLEKRWYEWAGLLLHLTWLITLLSLIPTWEQLVFFYFWAQTLQGILHVQLLSNHYSKEFNDRDQIITDWYRKQVLTNINIVNPVWLDFWHGGLNFHIEHHCFPRAPRNRLREISYRIKDVCKQHNVHYDECGSIEVLKRTLVHLKKTGDLFALKDPR